MSPAHRKVSDDDGSRTELARRFVESLVSGTTMEERPTFDHTALQGLTVVEVAEGRIVCEMPVTERVQNRYGTLHGGATATLVDTISTAALLTCCPHSGVSVHLAVTYLAPMPGSSPGPGATHNKPSLSPSSSSPGPSPSPELGAGPGASGPGTGAGGGPGVGSETGGGARRGGGDVEMVVVDARVTRVGRQLASLAVELRRKATGQLVATGTHTKFLQVADPAIDKLRARAGEGGAQRLRSML